MEKFTGNKIIVLGCSGSGKSTFSRKLAARTGLPLIHLDNIWWRPDQTHITREEFDQKLNEILHDDFWISATRSQTVKSLRTSNGFPLFGELVV